MLKLILSVLLIFPYLLFASNEASAEISPVTKSEPRYRYYFVRFFSQYVMIRKFIHNPEERSQGASEEIPQDPEQVNKELND